MPFQTRSQFDQDLQDLNNKILQLSSMVIEATEKAMDSLYSRNTLLARDVVNADQLVNELRYNIEMDSLRLLATQQPAARDLRQIIAAIHIAVELERIGDHAADIASLAERLEDEGDFDSLHKLPKMAKRASDMVNGSVTAYVERDPDLAKKLINKDEKIDKHYYQLRHEVLQEMIDNNYIRRASFLLWVGHNLERIGDRATNIAERVIFQVTGEFVES